MCTGAEVIYKSIISDQTDKYINLTPWCNVHQLPCRACGLLATLYDQGGVKNVRMLECLKEHLKVVKITDRLFLAALEVQLRNPGLYRELFPINTN